MTEQKELLKKVCKLNCDDGEHSNDYTQGFTQAIDAVIRLFEPAQTFKVGEYYVSENNQIYKLTEDKRTVIGVWRRELLIDDLLVPAYVSDEELQQDRKATTEEIALFKRAEHFHKHGRKLNEFRQGDLIARDNDFYFVTDIREDGMIYDRAGLCGYSDYEDITIYLTAEELEAAAMEGKG